MQQDEILNGTPVGSKRKAACEPSDVTNGATEDDNEGKNHAKEGKRKRKRKKQSDEKIEKEEEKHSEEFTEEKEKPKGKRKNSEENLGNTVSCLGEGVTPEEGTKVELKKKKKKKKSLVDDSDRTTTSKKSNSDHKHGLEESGITNGDNSSEEQQSNEPLVNGSSENDASAVNGDLNISPENNDQALSSRVTRKALRSATGPNSEAFAKFQKNSTPPAFVRKCLAKTPSTEPRKSKTNRVKVGDTFLSCFKSVLHLKWKQLHNHISSNNSCPSINRPPPTTPSLSPFFHPIPVKLKIDTLDRKQPLIYRYNRKVTKAQVSLQFFYSGVFLF